MVQGVALTEAERATVLALHGEGKSSRAIANNINRGRDAVLRVIKSASVRGGTRKRGVHRKLPLRAVRLLLRAARTGRFTASELQRRYAPQVTVRRVQQLLAADPTLSWEKAQSAPALYPVPRSTRMDWVRQYLPKGARFWRSVVFSDESRFSLDGPDGLSAHWQDQRRNAGWRVHRRNNGGSVMVWAAFSRAGKSELVFIDGTMDSSKYCATLSTTLLPFIEQHHPRGARFQQDNAPCHVSAYSKQYFSDMDIDVIDWPSRSPDLNPIENLWAILARDVYKLGRQFDTVADLKEALFYCWDTITIDTLQKLVDSMPKRLMDCMEARGGFTSF